MLDILKFIKGAISRKDLAVPVLTHFNIHDGVIRGSNGIICIAAPIPLALSAQPLGIPFTKAIEICEGLESIPALSMTPTGRLTVAAGSFRAHIECSPDQYPDYKPEGIYHELQPGLYDAFKALAPIIGEDASRPWARGILIRDGSCYATNNITIGQYWIGFNLPFDVNIPEECIVEVLRIKEEPIAVSATDHSITFHYREGRWIRSQLLSTVWPNIEPVLNRPSNPKPLPERFIQGLQYLEPYCDASRSIYFRDNRTLSTHTTNQIGATFELGNELGNGEMRGRYNCDQLLNVAKMVATIDFSLYPAPALYFGPQTEAGYSVFRGAIVGMKT
jgi:hypothetical protein